MIYTITRLFSKKEEYLNGKETDFQKNGEERRILEKRIIDMKEAMKDR